MSISSTFIKRPAGTSLLAIALAMAGCLGFMLLPVSPLPQVDFPTIQVQANLPGASPETMASSVATPLERQFGRIAGITEMTSTNYLGSTNIVLQFDLNRDINGAARDVQAAINAARGQLPANLPSNPNYRKVNPSDAPILLMSMTSDTIQISELYDMASSILAQKIAQEKGVGQVVVGGSSLPAVRVELNPDVVNKYGIGLDQVRAFLGAANANRPKGELDDAAAAWQISTTDQLLKAKQYIPLIVAYRNGAPVRLSDLGQVTDSVEDLRGGGLANGKRAVLIIVFRQPGANIIDTVDRVRALIPELQASISQSIKLDVINDRTQTIRSSVHDVEITLLVSIALVILVVFVFLRNTWATIIPSIAVPLSLLGTCGVMYLLGYSIDNLSLMALTISTGFVVDDAIVVIENISRHVEHGKRPMEAAFVGLQEIGSTVVSMTISLTAVFIPILLMSGIVGRLFHEFAVTLSVAIAVSLFVSLTMTPMMCSRLLKSMHEVRHGRLFRASEKVFSWTLSFYERTLRHVLLHPAITFAVLVLTVVLNVYLLVIVPKGFFPQQDTGAVYGGIQGSQDISFQALQQITLQFVNIIKSDPAVENVMAFSGGGGAT